MQIFESLRVALDMLRLHKMRSFLTMLGVIIGVMSVSLIILLMNGFKDFINSEFDSLSPDTIYIMYDPGGMRGGDMAGWVSGLGPEDRQFLKDRANNLKEITGLLSTGNHTLKSGADELKSVRVEAIEAAHNGIFKKEVLAGRLITDEDVAQLASVGVVTEEVANTMFGSPDEALGKLALLPGLTVRIVGVIKEPASIGPPSPKLLEIPISTAQSKWVGGRNYTFLLARASDPANVEAAVDEVWELMMARSGNRPVYRVESNKGMMEIFGRIIGVIGGVLAGVAALSLLVGGIGIMNIMLVSVQERTREIGLRKAVGAQRASILTQFLIEAAVLSLIGGLIGMGVAYLLSLAITAMTASNGFPDDEGLKAAFPVVEGMMAAGFSAAIGIVFGFFPAVSASKLDPIVALRYE
jgi:putative ABC transport system permease protein